MSAAFTFHSLFPQHGETSVLPFGTLDDAWAETTGTDGSGETAAAAGDASPKPPKRRRSPTQLLLFACCCCCLIIALPAAIAYWDASRDNPTFRRRRRRRRRIRPRRRRRRRRRPRRPRPRPRPRRRLAAADAACAAGAPPPPLGTPSWPRRVRRQALGTSLAATVQLGRRSRPTNRARAAAAADERRDVPQSRPARGAVRSRFLDADRLPAPQPGRLDDVPRPACEARRRGGGQGRR